ncbi:response regulator transcription factor [Moritella sp. F3]|uniref:response regulator n=1 Tax=Moritella sp. F3 TaxID=2718882 RepID=UPI0018E16C9E|nr:response regulator transcription factor [Moritella sp. F3]GIC78433.1 DNA-binding response regulator [Moritella sp. F1]GIC83933.1 DNA-binding response regulator [Moritella sp. F3]
MKVLIVEDEPQLAQQMQQQLTAQGFIVDCAYDGEEAHFMGSTETYDAVVLDLGLPKIDGLTVLKKWRAENLAMPVIILTARSLLHEKIEGLNAGADDYLAKPFQMGELVARLQALVRRAAGKASSIVTVGDIRLDISASTVTNAGLSVTLTAHEFKVLSYLMLHLGQVVSRATLIEHIYAQDFDRDSNTIEVFVGRLRKKLGSKMIETVRGLGYRIALD